MICVNELLFSDLFIDLVHEVADDEKRVSLECLVCEVLSSWSMDSLSKWISDADMNEMGEMLIDAVNKFIRFVKCIGFLLDVKVRGDVNPMSVKDVTCITSGKQSDSFLKVVRSLLTTQEPEAPDQNKIKAKSREFWMAVVNDLIKTAGTHDQCMELAKGFMEQLQSQMVQTGDDGELEHPVPLSPGVADVLQPCLESLPKLKAGSRKGSMTELIQTLKSKALQLAVGMLAAETPNVSSRDLSILLETLKYFGGEPGVPEMHTKLVEWATQHNASMATSDFIKLMDDYMELVSKQSYPEVIPMDAAEWKTIISKVQGPLAATARDKLHIFLPCLIVRIFLQAAGLNLSGGRKQTFIDYSWNIRNGTWRTI